MDPNEFLFLILPLATLVAILVIVVYRLATRDDSLRQKEMKTLNELIAAGELDGVNFTEALQGLLNDKVIDKAAFERLGKLLQESFKDFEEPVSQSELAEN